MKIVVRILSYLFALGAVWISVVLILLFFALQPVPRISTPYPSSDAILYQTAMWVFIITRISFVIEEVVLTHGNPVAYFLFGAIEFLNFCCVGACGSIDSAIASIIVTALMEFTLPIMMRYAK